LREESRIDVVGVWEASSTPDGYSLADNMEHPQP
jgi:hypothetical protein